MTLPHVVDVKEWIVVVVDVVAVEFEAAIAVVTAIVVAVAMQFDHNVTIYGGCIFFVADVAAIGWI